MSPPFAQPEQADITLNLRNAAALVGVGKWKLNKMIERGEIPTIRVGNRTMFSANALGDWLSAQDIRRSVEK